MADFPGSLHTFIDPATKSGQPLSNQHIAAHAEVAGELAAVEATLGVNPQGGFSTVAAHIGSILVQLSGAFTPTWPAAVTTPATYTSGGVYALTTLNGGTSWFMERVA